MYYRGSVVHFACLSCSLKLFVLVFVVLFSLLLSFWKREGGWAVLTEASKLRNHMLSFPITLAHMTVAIAL